MNALRACEWVSASFVHLSPPLLSIRPSVTRNVEARHATIFTGDATITWTGGTMVLHASG